MAQVRYYATGKRKNAVARVWLTPGTGKMIVNDLEVDAYFGQIFKNQRIVKPFNVTETMEQYDVIATLRGGGKSAQADALSQQMAKDMVSTLKEPDGAEKMKAKWQSGAFGMPGAEPSAEEMDSTDPDSAPGKAGGQEGAAPQGQGMPPEVQDALKGMFGK